VTIALHVAPSAPPGWHREGSDWPNREASRFVRAAGMVWHVQVMGTGPVALLAHGTGAATHSWRALAPLLAEDFTVVAPDLPGHGFSPSPTGARLTLPFMAHALADLCKALAVAPAIAVGHSAGAAIVARMCLDGLADPRALVSLNGALLPLYGLPGRVFSPLAKLIAGVPGLATLFTWHTGNRAVVERLLRETGSRIDDVGVECYARLAANPAHARAALSMMANWDLAPLVRDLPLLRPRLLLIVGDNDRSISPADSERVRALVPGADLARLPGLGHLAHEEAPEATARLVLDLARATHILGE
jgi:magnesium chelatase accessory protein